MRRALFLAVVLLFLAASRVMAQDPVKADPNPKHYKVEFENEQVRVLRVHLGPKESSPMHEHPPRVSVPLIPLESEEGWKRRAALENTAEPVGD
jgi:hypothetical protein